MLKELFEEVAYSGVKRRAQKAGIIRSDRDLTDKSKLEKVVDNEQNRLEQGVVSNFYWDAMLAYYSIGAGLEAGMFGFKREFDHWKFVPGHEAYDSQVVEYNPGTKMYETKTVHHDAVPDKYDAVWDWIHEHPEFMIPAIIIPAVAIGVIYANHEWREFKKGYITKKNIRKKAKKKVREM